MSGSRSLLAALAAAAVLATPARAQEAATPNPTPTPAATPAPDSALEARTRALASQLRCPVCQGLSLQDSPSELSQQMKDVVRSQLAQGKSEEQVKAYFVARYGEWILMSPPAHGFNLLVYALPLAGLGIGVAILVMFVRRWTRPASEPSNEQG